PGGQLPNHFLLGLHIKTEEPPTRPVTTWKVWNSVGPFLRDQLDDFCKGYYRDLLQSQPDHIEIIGEKNTIERVVRPVAMRYTLPYTTHSGARCPDGKPGRTPGTNSVTTG